MGLASLVPKRARTTPISSASTAQKKLRQFVIAGIGKPQNRLRDGDVAPDFLVRWVCGKSFPEVEIFLFVERKSRKKQTRLSGRPAVPRHHVRLVGPGGFIREIRIYEFHRLVDVAPVGQSEPPQIIVGGRKHLAQRDRSEGPVGK